MRRRKLEGYSLGRAPLIVDHQSLVRDRLSGMSLTNVAKKYGVSRASVVRFTREATKKLSTQVGEFHSRGGPSAGRMRGLMPEADSVAREADTMLDRVIMGIGAICSAAGLGFVSFAVGYDIARSGNLAGAKNVETGLLLSIAVAVWGIFALQLWRKPGKG